MSLLSVTDIVIIAATIGGFLILVCLTAIFLLARRRIWNHRISSFEIEAPTGKVRRWHTNDGTQRRKDSQPLAFQQLHDEPAVAQTSIRSPYLVQLFRGLLPSRYRSVLSSEWAVKNGAHVPRPRLLRKSRGTVRRDSWLSVGRSGVDLPRSVIPSTYGIPGITNDDAKQTRTVKARMAQMSGPSGNTHIVSMIVEPERDTCYTITSDPEIRAAKSKTNLAKARTSWQTAPRLRSSLESLDYRSSPANTPGSWSYSLPRTRRSMSLPYIPSSRPPSSAIPPVPSPSYHPRLLVAKRVVNANGSPSKLSFASQTTTSSSIFDGISPSLRKDLWKTTSGTGRSDSGRRFQRQTSVSGSKERQLFLDGIAKSTGTLGRRSSGASSQLLPSPARPVVRQQSPKPKKTSAIEPRVAAADAVRNKRTSYDAFRVRNRDIPVSLIGLQPGWDVFGYGGQMLDTKTRIRASVEEPIQPNPTHSHSSQQNKQLEALPGPKLRVLQKKWTKQENYTPLAFAAVAYRSAVSLDTPVQVPGLDNQASSIYSIPSTPIQKSTNRTNESGSPELKSKNGPFSRGDSPVCKTVNAQAENELQGGLPSPKHGLFGPRQMPNVMSQTSHRSPPYDREDVPGHELGSLKLTTISGVSKSLTNLLGTQDTSDQPRKTGSAGKLPNYQTELISHNTSIDTAQCEAPVVPPPVKLDPTARRSFYSYEAVPVTAVHNRPPSFGGTTTLQSWQIPARTVASRQSSNLSASFRTSALDQLASRRSSAAESRLSVRGSALLANSQSLILPQASSRPISAEARSSKDRSDPTRISRTSSNLESACRSSASPTPLKKYSDVCDMFPRPLSVKSGLRPPTWVLPRKSEEPEGLNLLEIHSRTGNTTRSLPPHLSRLGLPPHPRFFIEEELGHTGVGRNPQIQDEPVQHNVFDTAVDVTANLERPPSRRSHIRMTAGRTQTAPSITNLHSQSGSALMSTAIQAPEINQASRTSNNHILNREASPHKHTNPKPQARNRTSILEPISINIGSPTTFTANQSHPISIPRYRETAPSPSSLGSTSPRKPPIKFINLSPESFTQKQTQGNIHGTIGQERQKANASTTQNSCPNTQLKQRINQARQRKVQTQTQAYAHAHTPFVPGDDASEIRKGNVATTGLGITFPVLSYFSSAEGGKLAAQHETGPVQGGKQHRRRAGEVQSIS